MSSRSNKLIGICGNSGSGKSMLSNLLRSIISSETNIDQILNHECDRYHKWDRYSDKWSVDITHLNPESNNLDLLKTDVLDLKYNKTILRHDYDHSTGLFTENELIEPRPIIVICGLHTLYKDLDKVYDLSIYLEPQEKLRTLWKIKRDLLERNHKLDVIIKSIINRKNDFKYINIQEQYADITIKFMTDDHIELDLINNDLIYENSYGHITSALTNMNELLNYYPNISLNLTLNINKINITNIIALLTLLDIKFEQRSSDHYKFLNIMSCSYDKEVLINYIKDEMLSVNVDELADNYNGLLQVIIVKIMVDLNLL